MISRVKVFLLIIVLLSAILRFYKLDTIPPSLNWDEAGSAYNAYTIANWGRDEWGKFLPLIFTSFRDDKHPVHIYLTSVVVKLLGLSDFTARLSGAIIGVLSVIVIFYLARLIFKNDLVALFSALFLAVSPYNLHFSRGLWEANFALFFFLLGLLMFYLSLQKKSWLINISFFSFGLSLLSYHSAKIIVPSIVLMLIIFYFKILRRLSLNFYTGIFIFVLFIVLLLIDPRLIGLERAKQTQFGQDKIKKTLIYQKTKNLNLGLLEVILNGYISHFTPKYLFFTGDQNPRNSVKTQGEFYKTDALFILIGLFYLLRLKSRVILILLGWILLSPLPSSLVEGAPNAVRAIFMMGGLHLLAALGVGKTISWFRGKVKLFVLMTILFLLSMQVYSYLYYYFNIYPKKDAIEWQYGMKQIVEYVKDNEYSAVYVTDIRSQPYIFFLYYLKMPLPEYLGTVIYTKDVEHRKYNLVFSFDKYYFGGWDPIESLPTPGVLYVLSPSQYDGLRYRSDFNIKQVIHYPNGGDAFFLVSAK